MVKSGKNLSHRLGMAAARAFKSAREFIAGIPDKVKESYPLIVLVGSFTLLAVSIAVLGANGLLFPLRVYLTGTATPGIIGECQVKVVGARHPAAFFSVRIRGSSDFIPIARCDPKVTGESVSVIHSKIADTTVAVKGGPTLLKIYLALDGPYGLGSIVLLILACGLTLHRAKTILRFGSTEIRTAWAPVTRSKDERWKSLVKASEVLTDFLFLGLIVVATGIVVYALFRTTLYAHGETWFSVLAVGTLAITFSGRGLQMIARVPTASTENQVSPWA